MTLLEAQRAARRGGHQLKDAGRTPNGLYRMLVCERCGGKILARSAEEAGGEIAVWSCSARRELGYAPRVSLREGVRLAAAWYRQQHIPVAVALPAATG